MVHLMNDIMIITPAEWVLLLLTTMTLVQVALICINLRSSLAKAEQRPAFDGLIASLGDVRHRKDRKTLS